MAFRVVHQDFRGKELSQSWDMMWPFQCDCAQISIVWKYGDVSLHQNYRWDVLLWYNWGTV